MENTAADHEVRVLDALLEQVHRDGGHDFRGYKRSTVMRRLEGRLYAAGAETYTDYMDFLNDHPEEYQKLADTLTIKISDFFRSPYTFQQVARLVLPGLTSHRKKRKKTGLRFWSVACARGQEPYSISMLLTKSLGNKLKDFDTSIYATDISHKALEAARSGTYSTKDVENLTPTDRKNFFIRHNGSYTVRADIKQTVSFYYFDLASTTKPPFTNVDCIFCCNILIYLQKPLQERVLSMLYDSLATPGYLILGEVETPTNSLNEKLNCLDAKAKIYRKDGREEA